MELTIETLIEKYWNGETSLDEEQQLKMHFKTHSALSKESEYFQFLKKEQQVKFDQKVRKNSKRTWLAVVATVAVGVLIAVQVLLQESDKYPFAIDDPKQALEATKRTLMMIGSELNEEQFYTMELTKINKAKDELKGGSEDL